MNILRYLQGERRGMGSQLGKPEPMLVELAGFLLPSIVIQTLVRIADVSFWQDLIDFVVMRAAGILGVIIRAGQRTWVDSRFKENWAKAKAAGIPRGSYWFYDSREDPKRQAALWWSLLQGDVGELIHVADFEESYNGAFGDPSHFKQFILEFQRLSGLPDSRIAIYTGHFWWHDRVGNDIFFRRFSLWLAWYADMSVVRVPMPWVESELLFWQYTSSGNGTAYGVSSKEIDLNWYSGDAISFTRRFGLEVEPPEPPTGETMDRWKVTWDAGCNKRPEPTTSNIALGVIPDNTEFDVIGYHVPAGKTEAQERWGRLIDLNWVALTYNSQTRAVLVSTPPTDPPTITLTHTIEVYNDGSIRVDGSPYP